MAVLDATRDELERLNAIETVEGQAALVLAEQLDATRKNGMAVAGDVKTLVALMVEIRAGVKTEGDSVDDSRDEADRILRAVG